MKTILKILTSILITPLMIILLIGAITIATHETLWKSKKGNLEVE
tara:strand:- start:1099 stop:1233 length:135 start_codon:yes stop_codon:yes gene_type:complete